jgi:hypothetical protein
VEVAIGHPIRLNAGAAAAIRRGATVLSGKQIELGARQLEQRCRDVEF